MIKESIKNSKCYVIVIDPISLLTSKDMSELSICKCGHWRSMYFFIRSISKYLLSSFIAVINLVLSKIDLSSTALSLFIRHFPFCCDSVYITWHDSLEKGCELSITRLTISFVCAAVTYKNLEKKNAIWCEVEPAYGYFTVKTWLDLDSHISYIWPWKDVGVNDM